MNRNKISAVGLLAAGVLLGGALAGTLSASAATSGTISEDSSSTAPSQGDNLSSKPVRNDESAVSADLAATLTQKAEAKTGGTVYRVETDSGDATYEAHVKLTDGTLVTVKFDSAGTITAVEDGMGKGGPAPEASGSSA